MSDFDRELSVAQSCGSFRTVSTPGGRAVGRNEGISCSACANWNGSECIKNAYDNVASRLGID